MSYEITVEEKERLEKIIATLDDQQLADNLLTLAEREVSVLKQMIDDDLSDDLKEITLWNIAILSAAVSHFQGVVAGIVPIRNINEPDADSSLPNNDG